MFSRCPQCQTVHALNASDLAGARGLVRCGHCSCAFNALSQLFDYWPDSTSTPAPILPQDAAPVLGTPVLPEPGTGTLDRNEPVDATRTWWRLLVVILSLLTVANLAWTFRAPLQEIGFVQGWLDDLNLQPPQSTGPYRDLSLIHLVSRDMHQHPTRTGMLALSVIFVNRAPRAQPYPVIRIRLFGRNNEVMAERGFQASEYLPHHTDPSAVMSPNVQVPVLFEFVDPGTGATGFEVEFE